MMKQFYKAMLPKVQLYLVVLVTLNLRTTAQTVPAPFDLSIGNYSFTTWDAASTAGTYPQNMIFWRTGSNDPGLAATPAADYAGAYNGTSGTRMNGLGNNGVSFTNTATSGNLGMAVLALNTTGRQSIQVGWTGRMLSGLAFNATSQNRAYAIRLQYYVGNNPASGSWTDVPGPVEFSSLATADTYKTNGTAEVLGPVTLPAACENQPAVYLRWFYYLESGSAGMRPTLGLDDITVSSSALATGCTPPATQTTAFTFTAVGANTLTVSWTNGSGDGRLVKINTTNSFTAPAQGDNPVANPAYAGTGEQVVFNGTGNSVTVTGLNAGTVYYFRAFEYCNPDRIYQTAASTGNPASVTTDDGLAISLTGSSASYTQNFNTLAQSGTASNLPQGWYFTETGSNANATYTAGTGSSNTGDTYSFGATDSDERALGAIRSGTLVSTWGAKFVNNTGSVITSMQVSYTGEQWRLGATGRADRIEFSYSTDATSLTTGTWTRVTQLDFIAPVTTGTVGALNGNAAENRQQVAANISSLNLPNGAVIWFRFEDIDVTGADDGLAIDDFTVQLPAPGSPLPVRFTAVRATSVNQGVAVEWTTGFEENIRHFEVEKSADGFTFMKVGTLQPFNQLQGATYRWIDPTPNNGVNFYRIRSVDENGAFALSPIVNWRKQAAAVPVKVYPTIVSNAAVTVELNTTAANLELVLWNMNGTRMYTQRLIHTGGRATQIIQLPAHITGGMYLLTIEGSNGVKETTRIMLQ